MPSLVPGELFPNSIVHKFQMLRSILMCDHLICVITSMPSYSIQHDPRQDSVLLRLRRLAEHWPNNFSTVATCCILTSRLPRVRIVVGGKVSHEGIIFAVCPITNLVAVNTAPPPPTPLSNTTSNQPGDYRILPISDIRSFEILSVALTSVNFEDAVPSIGAVDMKAVKAREEAAIRRLQDKEMRRGKGVGKEGQDIFNALDRTYVHSLAHDSIEYPYLSLDPVRINTGIFI